MQFLLLSHTLDWVVFCRIYSAFPSFYFAAKCYRGISKLRLHLDKETDLISRPGDITYIPVLRYCGSWTGVKKTEVERELLK